MDPDEQKLIQTALDEAKVFQRKVSRESEAQGIADLKAAGMELTELAPEEVAKLRETVKPVIAKFTAAIDPAIVKEFMDAVEAARKM